MHFQAIPVSRKEANDYIEKLHRHHGKTVEILRLCTDGTPNACSYLYSRAVKIAELLGYEKVITYTLLSENGASLKASGFTLDGVTRGGSWSCKSRPRAGKAPTCPKKRWIRYTDAYKKKTAKEVM